MTTNHKLDIQWAKGHDKALCVAVEKSKVTQWRWTHQQLEAEKQQRHKAAAANDLHKYPMRGCQELTGCSQQQCKLTCKQG